MAIIGDIIYNVKNNLTAEFHGLIPLWDTVASYSKVEYSDLYEGIKNTPTTPNPDTELRPKTLRIPVYILAKIV